MAANEGRQIAIVGMGAIMPDADTLSAFWQNICAGRYSIGEVPPERWRTQHYWDPDPAVPDKTYSKIGGFVRGFELDWQRFKIPPRVAAAMDDGQKWAVTVAAEVLSDFGYPSRPLDKIRTGVVLGTAMGGDFHLDSHARIAFPEFVEALESVGAFGELDANLRAEILAAWRERVGERYLPVTEDTMPGELPNIMAGRVANVLDLKGPSFVTDAACASSLAAVSAAVELLDHHHCDAVLTGGVDRNMSPSTFVKFAKIGALSANGSRPFSATADGFVMGEGCAMFLLKRRADAERDGDRIYALIRGVGESSDGKGKGITAPNPVGQRLAIERAWADAGLSRETVGLIEAHGTSTPVGDAVELNTLREVFGASSRGQIAIGSVKGNVGHLKAAAGAAGLAKAVLALHHRVLPPTLNATEPSAALDEGGPLRLNHALGPWEMANGTPRRAAVSSYGFGGTNFHLVVEEYRGPEPVVQNDARDVKTQTATAGLAAVSASRATIPPAASTAGTLESGHGTTTPLRGILALGAASPEALGKEVERALARAGDGLPEAKRAPDAGSLAAPERLVVDFGDVGELRTRLQKAARLLANDDPRAWAAIEAQGVFRGRGFQRGKVAFLFPGQGSQYLNMGRALAEKEPVVAKVFAEADAIMAPILGRPLTEFVFVDFDPDDREARAGAERALMDTAVTQPAMLTIDIALHRLLAAHGFSPDMVMGHSLGEYAALIAAGIMPFAHALEATAARGREMAGVQVADRGLMAAVFAPVERVSQVLADIPGYVVAANLNSRQQSVIGGASAAVKAAMARCVELGFRAQQLPVSHAFHTKIVESAVEPLGRVLARLEVRPPAVPLVHNVTGEFGSRDPDAIRDLLKRQVAAPVQWVKGLESLYSAGARTFVEVGPKKVLKGLADDVFAATGDIHSLFVNHPKVGELQSFNHALCALWAKRGVQSPEPVEIRPVPAPRPAPITAPQPEPTMTQLAELLAQALRSTGPATGPADHATGALYDRGKPPAGSVVVSGTGLGLPGAHKAVMAPDNALALLRGEQLIDLFPERLRTAIFDKRVTRLVKEADGTGRFEIVRDKDQVFKLAGRPGSFDLGAEYGVAAKLVEALDVTSQLAIAAGFEALREAGIPLARTYRVTRNGKSLPDRWLLPESLRDETGIIFASAFPGLDALTEELQRFYVWQSRQEQVALLEELRQGATDHQGLLTINRKLAELRAENERAPYHFDRRFLFRILAMGHSQFAELIGARGPSEQINVACASTAAAMATAEDWLRTGRCRRVIVISADNANSDNLLSWIGTGFQALGAMATDDRVEEAALPFDRRRHGILLGMGAAALLLETQDAVAERGMRAISEVLATASANSAFHPSRLDVDHIATVMEDLLRGAELRFGLDRKEIAGETVFISHETYSPARGGSAAAEVAALRRTFGDSTQEITVCNTKGFTGHAMGAGIEDVMAVKVLEHGIVPPVPHLKEPDPDLGPLNLSQGGRYPVRYALRLAAGFGSQVAMSLSRRIPGSLDRLDDRLRYDAWLAEVSGYDRAETEVQQRVLKIREQGLPGRAPAPSRWQSGLGPQQRAPSYGREGFASPVQGATDLACPTPRAPFFSPNIGVPIGSEGAGPLAGRAPTGGGVDITTGAVSPPETAEVHQTAGTPHAVGEPPVSEVSSQPARAGTPPQKADVTRDQVAEKVKDIFSERTGYPKEMLELDLDLEADLGIDTVKQAETVAEVRSVFDLPENQEFRLRDYPTLGHVVELVRGLRREDPIGAVATVEGAGKNALAVSGTDRAAIASKVVEIVARQTGYPEDMLDLDLDLEADLGIDTVKQAETVAEVRVAFGLPEQEQLNLRDYPTLGHVVELVHTQQNGGRAEPAGEAVPDQIKAEPVVAAAADENKASWSHADLVPAPEIGAGIVTVAQTVESPVSQETTQAPAAAAGNTSFEEQGSTPVNDAAVVAKILTIVAQKTGYPEDMLELDLDMEADLGIDTVKQAETVTEVRAAFGIPEQKDLSLRDFPTLGHVVQLVKKHQASHSPAEAEKSTPAGDKNTESTEVEAVLRRPVAVLRPELSLCQKTAVELSERSRVLVVADQAGAGEHLCRRLEQRGVAVGLIKDAHRPAAMREQVEQWLSQGPVTGLYWLAALDVEAPLVKMDDALWETEVNRRYTSLHQTVRLLYDAFDHSERFLVAATGLGGVFGLDDQGATAALAGATTGLCKALARERPEALVKVIDFAPGCDPEELSEILMGETEADPGVIEVGYRDGQRLTIDLVAQEATTATDGAALAKDSVIVVTGASGAITSAMLTDLVPEGGVFYLLNRTPAPASDDPHIAAQRRGRQELMNHLLSEAKATERRLTPKQLEERIIKVERRAAALRVVEGIEARGGTAFYRAVDIVFAQAVDEVVDEIKHRHGRIDLLLHAAGNEISRRLPDKSEAELQSIFAVKAQGLFNILRAAGNLPIKRLVSFGSLAGRFGNAGQTDYSAANDCLCKIASNLRRSRPDTEALVIDWGGWAEIGMAARGSIPTVMAQAGIDLIPPAQGIALFRDLLAAGATGETVAAGRLGILAEARVPNSGVDLAAIGERLKANPPRYTLLAKASSVSGAAGFAFESLLDPAEQPFLCDHQVEKGLPYLPGVMGIEIFAQLATFLVPSLRVVAVENIHFARPCKFFDNQARTLTWHGLPVREPGGSVVVMVSLTSTTRRRRAGAPTKIITHFSAEVRMGAGEAEPSPLSWSLPAASEAATVKREDIYRTYFHGPAYQVVERALLVADRAFGVARVELPAQSEPQGAVFLMAPRAIELCFQTAGLWEIAVKKTLALPASVDRVVFHRHPNTAPGELVAVVEPSTDQFTAHVVDDSGAVYLSLTGYRTTPLANVETTWRPTLPAAPDEKAPPTSSAGDRL